MQSGGHRVDVRTGGAGVHPPAPRSVRGRLGVTPLPEASETKPARPVGHTWPPRSSVGCGSPSPPPCWTPCTPHTPVLCSGPRDAVAVLPPPRPSRPGLCPGDAVSSRHPLLYSRDTSVSPGAGGRQPLGPSRDQQGAGKQTSPRRVTAMLGAEGWGAPTTCPAPPRLNSLGPTTAVR